MTRQGKQFLIDEGMSGMNKILIVAPRDDLHASAVDWGLRQLGLRPVLWDWSEFPANQTVSLSVSADGRTSLRLTVQGEQHDGPFDAIWWRRRTRPVAPAGAHPDDVEVIERQSEQFLRAVLPFAAHAVTRWVNEPGAARSADNKARQLVAAQRVGFRIPATLMGNAPDVVRAFLADHGGTLAHKGFAPMRWENEDGTLTFDRTARVGAAQLASDFALAACPSIYQELLAKQYELRVTVMGQRVLATHVDSQRDGPTTDWRYEGDRGRHSLSAAQLPAELEERCVRLCADLGLNFGCIDLVVTPDGEVVFLEVNEAGQFVFNESVDPSIPMLDAFCRYLGGIADDRGQGAISLRAYKESDAARQLFEAA
jgi:hypothetical protein